MELKGLPILLPDVNADQLLQVTAQFNEFVVFFVVIVRNDGHSILNLISIWIASIVDEDYVLQIPTLENPKIFDEYFFLWLDTVISEKSMVDQLVIWVEVVKYNIGIAPMWRCENHHLKNLGHFFKDFFRVGPDVDPRLFW